MMHRAASPLDHGCAPVADLAADQAHVAVFFVAVDPFPQARHIWSAGCVRSGRAAPRSSRPLRPTPPDRPSARPAQCPAVAVAFDEYVEHRGVDRIFLDQLDGQPGVRLRSLVVTVAGEKCPGLAVKHKGCPDGLFLKQLLRIAVFRLEQLTVAQGRE